MNVLHPAGGVVVIVERDEGINTFRSSVASAVSKCLGGFSCGRKLLGLVHVRADFQEPMMNRRNPLRSLVT